jgi:hypothetical protein
MLSVGEGVAFLRHLADTRSRNTQALRLAKTELRVKVRTLWLNRSHGGDALLLWRESRFSAPNRR